MRIYAFCCLIFLLSGCNSGVSGENGNDPFGNGDSSTGDIIKIGHFDQAGQFVEGQVGVSLSPNNGTFAISAGGSLGLNVVLVDENNQRVTSSFTVEFTANCVTANLATLDTSINTVNGEASSDYSDTGCAGTAGTRDQITATVTLPDSTLIATQDIDILPEAIGSIGFQSVSADTILLLNTNDNNESQSVVVFSVLNQNGTSLADQLVEFSLSTEIGGITLSTASGVTDETGQVATTVIAGNVPTTVRVTATITDLTGDVLNTQSSAIAVTTGLPSQRSFTLSADTLNVEGNDVSGITTNITARLADTFGNPVPDNTPVTFTTEGGQIEPSCLTSNGACSVVWTSANPRTNDGRVTILATAIGHETLFDSNGNNAFDDNDGGIIFDPDNTASGFGTVDASQTGFVDFSEAWRDDNENRQWDSGEPFLDYNNNQSFDDADGLFNGLQCLDSALCGSGIGSAIHVRKALRLIVSGSTGYIDVLNSDSEVVASNYESLTEPVPTLEVIRGGKISLSSLVGDIFSNQMPAGTVFSISDDQGVTNLTSGGIVPNSASLGRTSFTFDIENSLADDEASVVAVVQIFIETPSGIETNYSFSVTLL